MGKESSSHSQQTPAHISMTTKVLHCILRNRFQVTMCLFSNKSQMTSKCGKNRKVAHQAIAERVTDTTF